MTPERTTEAAEVSAAYHLALVQLGTATIQDALRLWAGLPPTATPAVAASWLRQAVHLVLMRRSIARDLALAYYRLLRALLTGHTIPHPGRPDPPVVTLAMLRREFALLAGTSHVDGSDDADVEIGVEDLDEGPGEAERLEREAEREARIVLDALGTRNLRRKLDDIHLADTPAQTGAKQVDAHRRAGTRQATALARMAMNGARSTVWSLAARDKRVIGYVRVSRSGTPCGFCAMLISRGLNFAYASGYGRKTSRASTVKTGRDALGRTGEQTRASKAAYAQGDLYHDNCMCHAEPVFSTEYYALPRFDLNRRYGPEWKTVTKGYAGKKALSVWRRHIRDQDKARAPEARPRAQEASP